MSEALDLSLFARPSGDGTLGMDLAVEGIACGACIARIEGAVKRLPGVTEARLNFTNRRLHVAWTDGAVVPAQILQTLEDAGYRGYPFAPLRAEQEEAAEARRLTRCLAVAGFAAMNIMLLSVSVWSGNVTDITPETRDFFHWASALIALPAAAYAGRPFFSSAWRALRSGCAQHGCADLARRDPGARHVGGGNRASRQRRLLRFRHHAAVLPAGRARARSRHAPQDAGGRRQPGGAESRNRAPLHGRRIGQRAGGGAACRRPAAGEARRAGAGRRQRAQRHLRARREPDHRRNRAPQGRRRRHHLRRQHELFRRAHFARDRGRPRHVAGRDRAARWRRRRARSRTPCGWPTASRVSMRRWCI